MRAPGQIEPIIYFKDRDGKLMLAAYSAQPTPEGWMREEAGTLPEARKLERRLQEQDREEYQREGMRHMQSTAERSQRVRDNIMARIKSSAASEYEKEFLRYYLQLSNDKCAMFEQRWLEHTSYLWALHHDTAKDRSADEERVDIDKVNF